MNDTCTMPDLHNGLPEVAMKTPSENGMPEVPRVSSVMLHATGMDVGVVAKTFKFLRDADVLRVF